MRAILFRSLTGASASSLASASRNWRRPRTARGDRDEGDEASLFVASAVDEAAVRGAFQRGRGLVRGSGGATVLVGPGRVWLSLALSRSSVLLADASPDKILNRYVRPLLRTLGKITSVPVSYFGRDWISIAHRPVGFVGFAHDATSGRALFEAIIAVSAAFAADEASPSFMGKAPTTLASAASRPIADERVVDALVEAYFGTIGHVEVEEAMGVEASAEEDSTPWVATTAAAIGTLGCGPDAGGRVRLGGDLMASVDAIERLEEAIQALPDSADPDAVGRLVDEALTSRGAVTFGVRSLASIRDVIVAARTSLGGRSRT